MQGCDEIFPNDALNARNYFNTSKPPLHDNNFGYDFGGRLLPGVKESLVRNIFFWSQAFDRRSGPERAALQRDRSWEALLGGTIGRPIARHA